MNKKTKSWYKNEQKTWRRISEEKTQMANKHMKRYLTTILIKEIQIKTT